MKHLNDDSAIDLAEGRGEEAARDHVARCQRCQGLVEQYRTLLATVESVRVAGEPPLALQRWARAFARSAATPRRRWLVLPLLAGGTEALATVRGEELAGGAYLYGNDTHHLDLRVEPSEHGAGRLYGQLLPLGEEPLKSWWITVVTPDGESFRTTTGNTGEFLLEGIGAWERLTLVAGSGTDRVVVARIGEGEPPTEA